MRLIMVGTGPFGLPAFRALYATQHSIEALVTGPLRPARSRRPAALSPLRELAERHGTPIFDPEDINSDAARAKLAEWKPDLLVVCDYGQILSAATLGTARLGGINLHASLLPKYRGAAPVNWAIYHGETETGVSVIHMTPRMDAGPVIAQARTPIDPDETADELEQRLAELGAPLVCQAVDALASGRVEPIPQDATQASRAPRLKKRNGLIDWTRSAADIKNHVRAMQPWPKAYTFWHRPSAEPLRLIVGPVTTLDRSESSPDPGTILEAAGDRLIVAAGSGAVQLSTLQPAGKRMLSVAEFLRGYSIEPGQRLGPG